MVEGQNWQNARHVFEGCDFNPFFFHAIFVWKCMDVSFLIPLESLHFDLITQVQHKTLIRGQIC